MMMMIMMIAMKIVMTDDNDAIDDNDTCSLSHVFGQLELRHTLYFPA